MSDMKKFIKLVENAMDDAVQEVHDQGVENVIDIADQFKIDQLELLDAFTRDFEEDDDFDGEMYTLYADDNEIESSDSIEDLVVLAMEDYDSTDWYIEDNETGEIIDDNEGDDPEVIPTQAELDQGEIDHAAALHSQSPRKIGSVMRHNTDGYMDSDHEDFSNQDIEDLARQMEDAVTQTFPDGDPVDAVMHWVETTKGWDWFSVQSELMPKALKVFKQNTGYDDMYSMISDMWDNPDIAGSENPER